MGCDWLSSAAYLVQSSNEECKKPVFGPPNVNSTKYQSADPDTIAPVSFRTTLTLLSRLSSETTALEVVVCDLTLPTPTPSDTLIEHIDGRVLGNRVPPPPTPGPFPAQAEALPEQSTTSGSVSHRLYALFSGSDAIESIIVETLGKTIQ